MNIPLTQKQLLAVLKPVWDYLKYWEPKQMVGDTEILSTSKAIFFSFRSKKLMSCSVPGQAVCDILIFFLLSCQYAGVKSGGQFSSCNPLCGFNCEGCPWCRTGRAGGDRDGQNYFFTDFGVCMALPVTSQQNP